MTQTEDMAPAFTHNDDKYCGTCAGELGQCFGCGHVGEYVTFTQVNDGHMYCAKCLSGAPCTSCYRYFRRTEPPTTQCPLCDPVAAIAG